MENGQAKFEGFALVEIMGHQTAAGYVSTEAFGSVAMFRVTAPEIPPTEMVLESDEYVNHEYCAKGSRIRISREKFETLIGVASVYRMTPCSEAQAMAAQGVKREIVEKVSPKQLTYAAMHQHPDDDDDADPFEEKV